MMPTLTSMSLDQSNRIDAYWAAFLGCGVNALRRCGDTLVYQPSSPGVFCLTAEEGRVFSLRPGGDHRPLQGRITHHAIAQALAPLGTPCEVFGPGDILYCSPETFRPAPMLDSRLLNEVDSADLDQFAATVGWKHDTTGRPNSWHDAFGICRDGKLVSVATIVVWGGVIGAIKVATLPRYRGHGFARAVVSAATAYLFEHTALVPQYDFASDNARSREVGFSLGFVPYGQFHYGRLPDC